MTKPKHAPRVPFALLITGLVVGGLALLLVLNTFSAANELRRHDLATRDASIAAQLQELQNEVADSAAPANLAAAAVALGMVPAGNPAFLVIGRNGKARVMGSAAPASPAIVDLPNPPAAPKTDSQAKDKKHKKSGQKKDRSTKSVDKKTSKNDKNNKNNQNNKDKARSHQHDGRHKHDANTKNTQHDPQPSPDPTTTLTLPGGDR